MGASRQNVDAGFDKLISEPEYMILFEIVKDLTMQLLNDVMYSPNPKQIVLFNTCSAHTEELINCRWTRLTNR